MGAVFEIRRYSCYRMSPLLFGRRPSAALFFDRTPCCVLCLRSNATLVTGCYHCYLEGGLRPPYFSIGLLVGCCVRGHTLLLSSDEHSLLGAVFEVDATLVVGCYRCYLESGLRPPYFLMGLLVGCCVRDPTLLLIPDVTIVIWKAACGRLIS